MPEVEVSERPPPVEGKGVLAGDRPLGHTKATCLVRTTAPLPPFCLPVRASRSVYTPVSPVATGRGNPSPAATAEARPRAPRRYGAAMAPQPASEIPRPSQTERARRLLSLHVPGSPLLMPNPWDVGSAVLFASLGFEALATTSGGFAASRGRLDGAMTREEVLAHCGEVVAAVDVPVSADLENCFAHDPEGVAATVTAAIGQGLAGGSVEDFTGDRDAPIYELAHAAERVRAAAEAAHARPRAVRPHGPRRELPARPGGSGRHDRPAAGVSGGRCRRAVRTAGGGPHGTAPAAGRGGSSRQRARDCRTPRVWPRWPSSASAASPSVVPSPRPPTATRSTP